jgi:hypothetical protein
MEAFRIQLRDRLEAYFTLLPGGSRDWRQDIYRVLRAMPLLCSTNNALNDATSLFGFSNS